MAKKSKIRRTTAVASVPPTRVEFNPDYSNTKRDLQRIGTLAGIFFAILIALSFFIR